MHTGKVVTQRISKYWKDMKKQGRHDIIKCKNVRNRMIVRKLYFRLNIKKGFQQ